jgi:hypothetical protein
MPRIPGTTNRQTAFLRALRTHLDGPPPELWPSPAILRKWLRRETFRRALDSIRDTLTYQTDFALASAASSAARKYLAASATADKPPTHQDTLALSRLLRLAHQREGSSASLRLESPATFDLNGWSWERDDEDEEQQDEEEEEKTESATGKWPHEGGADSGRLGRRR